MTSRTIAPLTNVKLCLQAMERAMNRSAHLPGMVAFYGPSGYGKSWSAAFAANQYDAYYVEAKSTWSKSAFLKSILKEMGIKPANTIYDLCEQVSEQLTLSQRPLIIDEFDHVVKQRNVELIRDIYESSQASILLIGEEDLCNSLKKWERFHNRMLHWQPAQKCNEADALLLRNLYCNGVTINDDLMKYIQTACHGSARRICVNIELVCEFGRTNSIKNVTLADWGSKEIYTGNAPRRRV